MAAKNNIPENKLERQLQRAKKELKKQAIVMENLYVQIDQLQTQADKHLHQFQAIQNSFFWRITKPARLVVGGIKTFLRRFFLTRMLYKGLWSLRHTGIKTTWMRTYSYMKKRKGLRKATNHGLTISRETRQMQKNKRFDNNITISIVVPLFNTPVNFLNEMLESVTNQTYAAWELCLADGSENGYEHVEQICKAYSKKDNRIRYKKLSHNGGISYNTNQAIELAGGEYIGLLDHDDLLHPSLLFEIMQVIETTGADFIYTDEVTFEGKPSNHITMHFKPDFAIDNLRANNYICHFSCFSRQLLDRAGWFRSAYDGSQDYDIILRLTEKARKIVHIPKLLYFWRSHANSVASNIDAKPYCITAAKKAINEHLKRCAIEGRATDAPMLTSLYKIDYTLIGTPLISIIIPNKNSKKLLKTCIDSITKVSSYKNWEIIVVNNNSTGTEIFNYYDELAKDKRIRVVTWDGAFNFSAINNFGASYAKGEYLLLLNNDTKVITPNWMEEMLMYAQRQDVGAVGAKLYYKDDTVQHAGVVIGIMGPAGHVFSRVGKSYHGYMGRLYYAQNYSAVTAACLMVKKDLYEAVDGLDENLPVAYNDIDFCLKLRQRGKLNCFTPFAELYHYESVSRGNDQDEKNLARWQKEAELFKARWQEVIDRGDPYYNPNLTTDKPDFSVVTTGLEPYQASKGTYMRG
jgi:GT2 family glycosyltransferase